MRLGPNAASGSICMASARATAETRVSQLRSSLVMSRSPTTAPFSPRTRIRAANDPSRPVTRISAVLVAVGKNGSRPNQLRALSSTTRTSGQSVAPSSRTHDTRIVGSPVDNDPCAVRCVATTERIRRLIHARRTNACVPQLPNLAWAPRVPVGRWPAMSGESRLDPRCPSAIASPPDPIAAARPFRLISQTCGIVKLSTWPSWLELRCAT